MAFKIYKPGQGRYARISTGVLLGLLVAYGCASLKGALSEAGTLITFSRFALTYAQVVPVVVFIVLVTAIALGLNYAKFADFLIETEIEMGRVVWPTRKGVFASSTVVIVAVIGMAILLWAVDKGLVAVLELIKLY